MSDLDLYKEAAFLPEGPTPGADLQMVRIGVVVEKDTVDNRLKVSVNGSAGSWMTAIPNDYQVGQTAHVFCNPMRGGRAESVLGPVVGRSYMRAALLVSVGSTTAVIELDGAQHTVDFLPSTITPGQYVWVFCNPAKWGAPELIHGPCANPPIDPTPEPVPVPPDPGGTVQTTVTISPTWSGSYRVSRGAWDRWNTTSYGGRSDLYQGSAYGSGTMIGLATYGDQLANLGAISIDNIVVALVGNGGSAMPGPAVVQGSPNGSQPPGAPTASGDLALADMSGTTIGYMALPGTIREGMRTGAFKGLVLNGGGYLGVRGTGYAGSMALTVTYTRAA